MRQALPLLALFAATITHPAFAQTAPSEKNGKAVFNKWCAPCHGAEAPKTGMFATGALPGTFGHGLRAFLADGGVAREERWIDAEKLRFHGI